MLLWCDDDVQICRPHPRYPLGQRWPHRHWNVRNFWLFLLLRASFLSSSFDSNDTDTNSTWWKLHDAWYFCWFNRNCYFSLFCGVLVVGSLLRVLFFLYFSEIRCQSLWKYFARTWEPAPDTQTFPRDGCLRESLRLERADGRWDFAFRVLSFWTWIVGAAGEWPERRASFDYWMILDHCEHWRLKWWWWMEVKANSAWEWKNSWGGGSSSSSSSTSSRPIIKRVSQFHPLAQKVTNSLPIHRHCSDHGRRRDIHSTFETDEVFPIALIC